MEHYSYANKVAFVTGGTSGIGKATAIAFADAGAKVVLTGRREKEGAAVVAEIKKRDGEASFIRSEQLFRAAADAELVDAQLLPGNAFKAPLLRNVLTRILLDLTQEER